MALRDYTQIKADMADALAAALAAATGDNFAQLLVSSLGIPATWGGTSTVTCPDTSQVAVGNLVKASNGAAAGAWYEVASITPNVSFVVTDIYNQGSFPSGGAPSSLPGTWIWDGTNTILATNTGGVQPGDSIRLDSDGQFFFVLQVNVNTDVLIGDGGLTIPSGTGPTSLANSSRTTTVIPPPPSSSSLVDTFGVPVAEGVVEEGIIPADIPPNVTVAQANALSGLSPGQQVFVTNEVGGSVPAFWDGSNWRRVTDRGIIST